MGKDTNKDPQDRLQRNKNYNRYQNRNSAQANPEGQAKENPVAQENQADKAKDNKKQFERKRYPENRGRREGFDSRSNESRNNDSIITVIVPVLNEEESLPELSLNLESELSKVAGGRWEVIFVDDGSTDGSFDVIRSIRERNKRFRAIRFRRNYGKAAALSVGFEQAKGIIVITMDADLQDDPAEIPNLIAKLKEGYDLVTGWKKKRHDPFTKTIPSRCINFVTAKATGVKVHDMNCGLKAYRRDVVKTLNIYGEIYRYIPALANWEGFRVTEIPVKHHARRYGKSKYGFTRFVKGFLDLLTVLFTTKYFKRPLHFFGTIGTLFALFGFAIDAYLLVEWAMDATYLSNRPLTILGVALIIVGVQLFSFGLIGEMIVKSNIDKVKYSIREQL